MSARRPRLTSAHVLSALALFVALGGGAFAATKLVGSDGRIHGCVDRHGKLTVVKAGKGCGRHRRALAWYAAGSPRPEPWHVVKASQFTSSGCPTGGPLAYWRNADPAHSATAAFYRDPAGQVHLRGRVTGPANNVCAIDPVGHPVFRLPARYRPAHAVLLAVGRSQGSQLQPGLVQVNPNGDVVPRIGQSSQSGEFYDLSGTSFRAER